MLDARPEHLGPDQRAAAASRIDPHQPLVLAHHTGAPLIGIRDGSHLDLVGIERAERRPDDGDVRGGEGDRERRAPEVGAHVGEARRVDTGDRPLVGGLVQHGTVRGHVAGEKDR